MILRKINNEIDELRQELENNNKLGLFNNPSVEYMEAIKNKISLKINSYMNRQYKKYSSYFQTNFRRNFLNIKNKKIYKTNIGLKTFKLSDLSPEFEKAYKTANLLSLSLIKSQNDENMRKLQNRFLDWITLKTLNDDKAKLIEMTKIPSNSKRVKFLLKDQSNKVSSNLDNIIADKYQAICFQWKIRNNDRVVGKPGGLYPKATNPKIHGDHWIRKDKFYYYPDNEYVKKGYIDKSKFEGSVNDIQDGRPGIPIGCQCYSVNYYELIDIPKELLTKKGLENI